jgi:amidophosphoribosyltransferase
VEPSQFCIFEHIYFSRPDSRVFGEGVDRVRRRIGHRLAAECPAPGDVVISVPDSSNSVALGYSEASGIRFELGLIRNHYVGRTFIQPEASERDTGVRIKFNPVREVLEGRRVVVVDDSIVRGTTSRSSSARCARRRARGALPGRLAAGTHRASTASTRRAAAS